MEKSAPQDLKALAERGHVAVGLDGSPRFASMARAYSGCEVLQQDFLNLDLPAGKLKPADELKALLARFPDHAGAHNDLGSYYEERKEKDQARDAFHRAVKANPDYAPARLNRVRLLCDAQRFPDAKPHLEFLAAAGARVEVAAGRAFSPSELI